ncbi:hypothetical protein AKJ37_05690 [candidate division MSBL1 archaeon SCGC-AAA259I09]|uniref:Uncharacterized protein n=4 Tax=candidate division MSBL1 TaxID=215777 RepID=A0A133UPC5_9EURY|nr:hypothetical protein AKJ66_03600 [candidate division MSBL1 archaeon SCGC-AAA259E22]KXA95967.1 hypothetical protein AKJ38_04155 [candidate division MSBL1 archaeon SCGC-AAA259I14]KXA96246.1 hypothetical protein AKJ37_05690 [candidate division MSBL1 archaeon SCGC-AAA259I09]KXA99466.1 hypothetical protein AKJ40_03090 [candidate division MSBL1 archaeon SCGC-AAA259M10]
MNNGFLSKIDGQKIGGFSLVVEDRREGRFSEETNFELYLEDNEGEKSRKPVVWGKYFSGRGKYYSPWIELNFAEKIKFKSNSASFFGGNIGEELFETFFRNLPSGGRLKQ